MAAPLPRRRPSAGPPLRPRRGCHHHKSGRKSLYTIGKSANVYQRFLPLPPKSAKVGGPASRLPPTFWWGRAGRCGAPPCESQTGQKVAGRNRPMRAFAPDYEPSCISGPVFCIARTGRPTLCAIFLGVRRVADVGAFPKTAGQRPAPSQDAGGLLEHPRKNRAQRGEKRAPVPRPAYVARPRAPHVSDRPAGQRTAGENCPVGAWRAHPRPPPSPPWF